MEPDARLAAYLQERVLGSDVKVVEGTFEGADPPNEQTVLLDKLVSHAITDFGGSVERPFVTAMYIARRP